MNALLFSLMFACALKELPEDTASEGDTGGAAVDTAAADADADGYTVADGDCDDASPDISPAAEELCDGVDNNCDGDIDSDAADATTYYADADGDSFGDPGSTVESCEPIEGYVAEATDCDDGDALTWPGASERCDGVDNDCDGTIDDDLTKEWYYDGDGDGYGSADSAYDTCDPPAGWVTDATDCDDTNATASPAGTEVCDEQDNDCDGQVDENVTTLFFLDSDGDGHGDPDSTIGACAPPSGYVDQPTDCDDADSTISPASPELCDSVDNDCDGNTDEDDASDALLWFPDGDGDGYGDSTVSSRNACSQPSGYSEDGSDCDDSDATVHPGAAEVCDEQDNDCNTWIDAQDPGLIDGTTYYADADADGYGSSAYTTVECEAPAGYVEDSSDCDDTAEESYPGADEICDGADNDCDGTADEDATDMQTWYLDFDSDGYGTTSTNAGDTAEACSEPTGYVADSTDCQDTQPSVNPAAAEQCNDKDDDCDGFIDDDDNDVTDASTWYVDGDGDGYGSTSFSVEACDAPSSFVVSSNDCDDTDSSVKPGAVEVCDGADNNCDGDIDDDDSGVTGQREYYLDADNDGYGDAADLLLSCSQPSGRVPNDFDCDDGDITIRPGAEELCDEVDNNCDGTVDEGMLGSAADCAATTCLEILEDGSDDGSGLYWLAPTGDVADARTFYCDMSYNEGGWTRIYASLYDTWWAEDDWEDIGSAEDDDFSALAFREHFADEDGVYTLRLVVGSDGEWDTGDYDYFTVWTQEHDPITESSDGSDYVFLDGDEPSTCGGFAGLHSAYYDSGGIYALVSDADEDDEACWGMQILPLEQYGAELDYPGYLDGYSGGSLHAWQVLWVR